MNILFDIGGTKIRIAKAESPNKFGEVKIFETPQKYIEGLELLKNSIANVAGGDAIDALAGGVAGVVDRQFMLKSAPNIPDWAGKPLASDLEDAFNVQVKIENDTALAALGEANFGAGRGFGIVGFLAIGTGVGGARTVNGELDQKAVGFEPGHQIVDMGRSVVSDSPGIDLEAMIGGRAIEKRTGKAPHDITDRSFWDEVTKILSVGIYNSILHWSPDVFILGGSVMNKIAPLFGKLELHLKEIAIDYPDLPPLKRSELGDLSGLYGALHYTKQFIQKNN